MKKALQITLKARKNILPRQLYYNKRNFYAFIAYDIPYGFFD